MTPTKSTTASRGRSASRPMRAVRIENFSLDEVVSAADLRSSYEVALVFSTKYEPGPEAWDNWRTWTELKARFFGFHRDLPPAAAAQILGGRIVFSEQRPGQWVAVIEMDRVEEASRLPLSWDLLPGEHGNPCEPGPVNVCRFSRR